MIVENTESLQVWLAKVLEPLCHAESGSLSKYVLALLKNDEPEEELRKRLLDQLEVFLQGETNKFVEQLFDTLHSKEYLNVLSTESFPQIHLKCESPPSTSTEICMNEINNSECRVSEPSSAENLQSGSPPQSIEEETPNSAPAQSLATVKIKEEVLSETENESEVTESNVPAGSSPDKKVIVLNPVAVTNMFKSSKTASSGAGLVKTEDLKSEANRGQPKVQEILMLTQALASALKSEAKPKVFCSNTNCNMKTDTVVQAPPFAKLYFGLAKPGLQICMKCMKKAESFNEKSKALVLNKENLFDLQFEVQTSNSLVDLDSPVNSPAPVDLFETEDASGSTSDSYSVSVNKINSILAKSLCKLGLEQQIKKCTNTVNCEIDQLDTQFSAMDLEMESLADKIGSLVQNFNEKIVGTPLPLVIGSVDIDEVGSITTTRTENLDKIEGLSRLESKNLNKMLAELTAIDHSRVPPVQLCPSRASNSVNPPRGKQMIFVKPREGQEVYGMYRHFLCYWLPAKIKKITPGIREEDETYYTVQFQQPVKPRSKSLDDADACVKRLTGKQLAFKKPTALTLSIGCRIIAKFKDLLCTETAVNGLLYAGVVAEVPRNVNGHRYLIFFDDGYAQYAMPNEVFPVCDSSPDVWLDVHKNSQDFIRDYVNKFPDRHMIRAQIGTQFNVEINGKWVMSKIVDVDASLMKVQYSRTIDGVNYEWIYRGSTRLGPLFSRLNSLQIKPATTTPRRHTYQTRNGNYSFEVNRAEDEQKVAKKHTGFQEAGRQTMIRAKSGAMIPVQLEKQGKMIKIAIPETCPSPRPYVSHSCSYRCTYRYDPSKFRKVSPLVIPFYLGWARPFDNHGNVFYLTPCGVPCASYPAIHRYISLTQGEIPIDYFSLEAGIDALNEFEPDRKIEFLKDISYGKEWTPVTCVNTLDRDIPPYMEYITARLPGKGVQINDDDGFLVCCDCEDDCQDQSKCACWQLTLSGDSFKFAEKEGTRLTGYENRRLKQQVYSGIYECNRRCKCRQTCFNRVVQQKVKWPVQIFKTIAKGWGVRALHDMPQGSFICVYTGQLLTDASANEEGREFGDEYLAELDFIECNEQSKQDYESDVTDIESEEPGTKSNARFEKANGNGQQQKKAEVARKSTIQKAIKSTGGAKKTSETDLAAEPVSPSIISRPVARKSGCRILVGNSEKDPFKKPSSGIATTPLSSKRSTKDDSDSDDDEVNPRAYSSFSASFAASKAKHAPRLPLREYFGKDETVYIMDAKSMGNFGRYLNHSCNPNVFVQNLFVDTHDPRFPWVAFFTNKEVKAGTELTWDYHYEIGSVPDKTLHCYCLEPGCRGRLL